MTEKIQENEERGAAPEATAEATPASPAPEHDQLKDDLVAALKTVFDPEIPVDIYELGLIYRLDVDTERNIEVDMTLTAPGCPVAGDMPGGGERGVFRTRRRAGEGQSRLRSSLGPEPHVRRGAACAQHVLRRT
jgi:metal-sulfur cluster biosynthetic enzyme